MATCTQPGEDWTVVLRRQPARIVRSRAEGGHTDALRSSAATAVTTPAWMTSRSRRSFSGSAGDIRQKRAAERTRSTSGCTRSLRWRTGRKR
jgi:hypothetical protein